jgi:hypothetical protein
VDSPSAEKEPTEPPATPPRETASEEPPAAPPRQPVPEKPLTPEEVLAGPVGDSIRRELAREKITQVFGELQQLMERYRSKWIRFEIDRARDLEVSPPTPLDFDALAKKHGLAAGTLAKRDPSTGDVLPDPDTGEAIPVSQLEAQEFDVGRSYVEMSRPFAYFAFERDWPLYLAATSIDPEDGSQYLFWKVKELQEEIPKFDDKGMRQQVLEAWRMEQAREITTARAEKLAAEARRAGKSLKEAFPDRDVTQTPPFSWMTEGSIAAGTSRVPPRQSEVPGVEMPGAEFMRAVFGLEQGQISVAMNQPKTIAYVIRVVEMQPSEKVLWAQFKSEPYSLYASVAVSDQREVYQAWREELRTNAGLEWVGRRPDQPPQP